MNEPDDTAPKALREAVFQMMAQGLAADRSPLQARELIRKVDLMADREVQENRARQNATVDCKPGCSHCCHEVVFASALDVILAEDYIREHFSAEQLADLKGRLYQYERVVAPRFGMTAAPNSLEHVRTPCPFLRNGLCTIYEARPVSCRETHSTNVKVCQRIELGEKQSGSRPNVHGEDALYSAAYVAASRAAAQCGLATGTLDFSRAMAVALEEPEAVQRLFEGENMFMSAACRERALTRPRYGLGTYYRHYGPGEEPEGRIEIGNLNAYFSRLYENDLEGAFEELKTDHPVKLLRRINVPSLYRSDDEIDYWRSRCSQAISDLAEAEFDPREAFDGLRAFSAFEIAYQQRNDRDLLSHLGQVLVEKITAKALPNLIEPIRKKPQSGKLKVGYISENLTVSNGGSWARGWLRNHGPEIESYAFCLSNYPDGVTSRFRALANHFFLLNKNVTEHARFIKSLELDVLIYPDIGISGRNYQYATMRLAPVQCTAWGHPVTSGLPTIDYYLSSELMEPENGQEHYREQLVRLPGTGLSYPRRLVRPSRMTRADFGLDEGLLYLSCQNPMKYLPHWDHLYAEICERTGRPIVFVEGPKPVDKELLKERMAKAGVNAIWVPDLSMADFFGLVKLADVCLDSPGWNGGNTTIQALQERVPVVSLAGEFMRGRHGLAFCTVAGAPGLVASSTEDYVDLACSPDRISAAMADLEPENLFEDPRPAKALDGFLLGLFD